MPLLHFYDFGVIRYTVRQPEFDVKDSKRLNLKGYPGYSCSQGFCFPQRITFESEITQLHYNYLLLLALMETNTVSYFRFDKFIA